MGYANMVGGEPGGQVERYMRTLEARIKALREALDSLECFEYCDGADNHTAGCPRLLANRALRADDEAAK